LPREWFSTPRSPHQGRDISDLIYDRTDRFKAAQQKINKWRYELAESDEEEVNEAEIKEEEINGEDIEEEELDGETLVGTQQELYVCPLAS